MDRNLLKRAIEAAGGVRAVAIAVGLSTQIIYRNIAGKAVPSDRLLEHIGLERRVTYVRKAAKRGRTRPAVHSR